MILDDSHITLLFPPKLIEQADNFFKVYELIGADFSTLEDRINLKDPSLRVCRFCNQFSPKVTFNNRAHTIPEFLGNSGSISDFECDICNKQFGKLEKQLSNFIGPAITLNKTRGKKKIPSTPSYDKKVVAKNAVEFGSTENSSEKITYDEKTNQYCVEFTTQPFVPYDVYKALLKMAIGLLPESEVKEFGLALNLLQDIQNKKFIKGESLAVYINNVSSPYSYTGIFLFKKRDKTRLEPPLSMVSFYGQLMYQIYIPISLNYLKLINGKPIIIPLLPPMLPNKEVKENFQYVFEIEKLDSLESRTRKQYIKIIPDNRDKKMVALDPQSKKITDHVYNPHETVKFVILDSDFKIPLSKGDSNSE